MKRVAALFVILVLLLATLASADEGENAYQRLKNDYLHFLRDTHAQHQRHKWERHIRGFLSYAEQRSQHPRAADALFAAGDAYSRLAQWSKQKNDWREAVRVYDRLQRQYPDSAVAAQALFKAGEILEQKLGDSAAARERYQMVVDQFADAVEAEIAREALTRLGGSAATVPAETTPVPRIFTIVLDPGHGGYDVGAITPRLVEKELTLEMALRVRDQLRSLSNVRVFMTREDDRYLPLDVRAAIANELRADLFVSIHVNASENPDSNGIETFYYPTDEPLPPPDGGNLTPTPVRPPPAVTAAAEVHEDSVRLARSLHDTLLAVARSSRPHSVDRGVRRSQLVLLAGSSVAATLVETGFSTNAEEAVLLDNPAYRRRLADAIASGIVQYLASQLPDQ